jgi:hypothetical protein
MHNIEYRAAGAFATLVNRLFNSADVDKSGTAHWNAPDISSITAKKLECAYAVSALDEEGEASLGVMPIRKDLTTYPDPTAIREDQVGILAKERIGWMISDVRSVVELAVRYTAAG